MIRIFFTTTLLKTGAHDRVGVRAAFSPVFGETLLILNLPCQHVFVRSKTDSVRRKPRHWAGGPPFALFPLTKAHDWMMPLQYVNVEGLV